MRAMKCFSWIISIYLIITCSQAHCQTNPISNQNITSAIQLSTPSQWNITWGIPNHLTLGGFLNGSDEASSAEFRDNSGELRATVLVIKTSCSSQNPLGIYPHDFRRCSSIHGRSLEDVQSVALNGGYFYEVFMSKHILNEYEISFLVEDLSNNYRVDSELFASNYVTTCSGNVYNFQIWSDNSSLTESFVSQILSHLQSVKQLSLTNSSPRNIPTAVINAAQYQNSLLDMAVLSNISGSGDITVVAWTYPNPQPSISVFSRSISSGSQVLNFDLGSTNALATELEIYLAINGQGQDGILLASNHFGHFSSSWIPFAGSNSSVSLHAVGELLPQFSSSDAAFSVNDSNLAMNCTLASNSYCGMFLELVPETPSMSLSFADLDQIRFLAKTSGSTSLSNFDLKLETTAGITYSRSISVSPAWQEFTLSLASFSGQSGEVWDPNSNVERIVVAGVSGSSGTTSAQLLLGDLQVTRKPRLDLSVVGGGRINISPLNASCDGLCTFPISRSQSISLTPQANPGFQFHNWNDPALCQNIQLQSDRMCIANFRPYYSIPEVTIDTLASNGPTLDTTRFVIADNYLFDLDWNTLRVYANALDITAAFLLIATPYLEVDSETSIITANIPFTLPGISLRLDICRLGASGGQCASGHLP